MSKRIVQFLVYHDFNDYGDYFCWKMGGDGDNSETLMYQLDAFFEMLDKSAEAFISCDHEYELSSSMGNEIHICVKCGDVI